VRKEKSACKKTSPAPRDFVKIMAALDGLVDWANAGLVSNEKH
jgi:hypothetical protein